VFTKEGPVNTAGRKALDLHPRPHPLHHGIGVSLMKNLQMIIAIYHLKKKNVPEVQNPDVPEVQNPDVPEVQNPDVPEV